jgi:hypothetical protein
VQFFSDALLFVIRMQEQRPDVIILQVGNSKAYDSAVDLAYPAFSSRKEKFFAVLVGNKARVGQGVFFDRVPDFLYLWDVF